jgi:hypothetical protein
MRRFRNPLALILALAVLAPAPKLQASVMSLQTGLLQAWNFQLFGMTEYFSGVKLTKAATYSPIGTKLAGGVGQVGLVTDASTKTATFNGGGNGVPGRWRWTAPPLTMVWFGGLVDGASNPGGFASVVTFVRSASSDAVTLWNNGPWTLAIGNSFNIAGPAFSSTQRMIAVRATTTTAEWFVNGVASTTNSGSWTIGAYDTNSALSFGGTVLHREMLFYSRRLSNDEIRELWVNPLAWMPRPPPLLFRAGAAPATGFSPFLVGANVPGAPISGGAIEVGR